MDCGGNKIGGSDRGEHMHELDGCGCMREKDFGVGIWGLRGSYYIKSVFKFNLC